jgi:hypothetical protein
MFDIPGFNPSAMSDDELLNRQGELSRRLGWAARFSMSGDMSGQLYAMIGAIEAERRDRVLKMMFQERQKMFPEIIETEPDLAQEHRRKKVDDEKDERMVNRRKIGRERLTLTKTSTPPQQQPHFPQHDRPDEDDKDK